MTLWTACSAHPLLSTKRKALSAPLLLMERPWKRGWARSIRQACLGSVVLHSLHFSPCPLLSFECLQHQNSSLLSTILNNVAVVKQEALLKTPTLWVRGRRTSFSRIRTLGLLVETYPSYPEMDVFDNGKNKKVNLKKKKKKFLPHFKQVTRDLRRPLASTKGASSNFLLWKL